MLVVFTTIDNNNTFYYIILTGPVTLRYFVRCSKSDRHRHTFYTTKFSLTNFMCQMYFDCVNLSKNRNLHAQKHLAYEICQRKFDRVKGALHYFPFFDKACCFSQTKMKISSQLTQTSPF